MVRTLALLCLLPLMLPAGDANLKYPTTKRSDHVDDYHGVKVPDPYRWLEADVREAKAVADWVAEQNKVTFAYLNAIPERDAIRRRLTDLWNYEKVSAPFRAGPRYVFSKNDGLQNHSAYYTQETLDSPPQLLLDPNTWSKDGTVALAGMAFTEDGKYLAYGVSEAGSDWSQWKVLHVESRQTLGDEIRWVKFGGASWTHDDKGFFYSRYPEPKPGEKFQGLPLHQKLCYHRLGTPQNEDVLVYHRPDQPTWSITAGVTDDGRYLIIYIGDGTTSRKNRVLYKDLQDPYGLPVELIDNFDSVNSFIHNDGPIFYFKTDLDAPRGRVVAVDIRKGRADTQAATVNQEKGVAKEDWKEIIPQGDATLQSVNYVGNLLICRYLKHARTQVMLHRRDGRFWREVDLPGIGSALGFAGRPQDLETFYTFTSFNVPGRTYRYDLITGERKLFREPKVKFNADDYEVKQVFYPSKDGTKIPMFIAHKKGV